MASPAAPVYVATYATHAYASLGSPFWSFL